MPAMRTRIPLLALAGATALLALAEAAQHPTSRRARTGIPVEPPLADAPASTDFAAPQVRLEEPVPAGATTRAATGASAAGTQDGADGATRPPGDTRAKLRTVVRILVNQERGHRDRVARLERLRAIYAEARALDRLAEVARLRGLEDQRYAAAQKGYERDLGPALYAQVRAVVDAAAGAKPAAPQGGGR
jgi:hypothetical protein